MFGIFAENPEIRNAYRSSKPDRGNVGGMQTYILRAFIKRISWLSRISQILNQSQECSNGRCLSGMIVRKRSRDAISAPHIIQREASTLLFLL